MTLGALLILTFIDATFLRRSSGGAQQKLDITTHAVGGGQCKVKLQLHDASGDIF